MDNKSLSKGRLTLVLISLFLSTCCTMGDMVIVPIASNLYECFPNVMLVNAIISGPAITGVIFCIVGGRLTDTMNKKTLMIIGFAIFTISSVFGCSIENEIYILICRLLATGVAWGLTSSAALGILADLYTDEEKHGTIVGWYNAAMAIIGAILSFVAGNLALNGWKFAFRTYWISFPVLIMLIFFLPNMPSKATNTTTNEKIKGESGWYQHLLPLLAEILLVASCYYVIVYMISVYVTDAKIGNAAFAGTLSSIGTVASCAACMLFGVIYTKLKKATPLPSFFLLGICFVVMGFIPDSTVAIICCAIMGASWGIFYCFFYARCTEVVPENMQGTAIGITGAVNGLSSFFCTYIVTGLVSITGVQSCVNIWPVFGVICLVVGVIAIIGYSKNKN